MTRVYLDHNATTPLKPQVREHWCAELERLTGNASSVHASGRLARATLDAARERTAAALGVDEDEILFTSGGTESNNLAILGAAALLDPKLAIVTTAIEHSSVLGPVEALRRRGRDTRSIAVDAHGRPDAEALTAAASDPAVGLVTVMCANNEVGSLAPLAAVAAGTRTRGPRALVHTDAVQALGRIPLDLRGWGVDLASFSAHKVGGPLGVGILYKKKGVQVAGLLSGGEQEGGIRPGTENVPAIAAASVAIDLAVRERARYAEHARALLALLWRELSAAIPDISIAGPPLDASDRLPNTLNLSCAAVDGRMLVARLDLEGLETSAGSACASGSLEPSHVLLAMGFTAERARAALRISVGWSTNAADIHNAVDILRRTLLALR